MITRSYRPAVLPLSCPVRHRSLYAHTGARGARTPSTPQVTRSAVRSRVGAAASAEPVLPSPPLLHDHLM